MNANIAAHGIHTQFSSTRQPAKAGRKPSRLKKWIKDFDVSKSDIDILARNIIFNYSYKELKQLYKEMETDENLPVGIAALISGMLHDIKRGDNKVMNSLFDRIYGKPVDYNEMEYGKRLDAIEQAIRGTGQTVIDPTEIDNPYAQNLKKQLENERKITADLQANILDMKRQIAGIQGDSTDLECVGNS